MKASVKLENFAAGRWTLGQICHPLQVRVMIFLRDGGAISRGERHDQNK